MEIATAMAADDRTRFETLLGRHRGIVLKIAASYAWHAEDRADLAQEIATQLWRAFAGYDPARPFSTWMYRIALNVAIGHVRRHAPHARRTVPFDETLHDTAHQDTSTRDGLDRMRLLQRFIADQRPLDRALLLLYLEERTIREMSDVLGIGESNVTTKINRLKQRLRDYASAAGHD
ncbi:sigma-70 family RNA polymerase sigma factor [Luteimonas sp. RD2P54]|uniref:Sigma-70 family RNA polymerase sigma factor n=1 Tax=Luteimonas endophytica TaxID=3042023 RepID=A0ABT6JC99_9GAMM|nr:sigma-70 family RNA polymerase sigma factor [Luteimonas endophytica]MDH5824455.1 sigma-70 family RNA polymerase sigma factor [Luteimonas endophytica]